MATLAERLRRLAEPKKSLYGWEFIETIATWMNYGGSDAEVARDLAALPIPPTWRVVDGPLYRIVAWPLERTEPIPQRLSSWTLSLAFAKRFVHEHWFQGFLHEQPSEALIFEVARPKAKRVCVNLVTVFHDPAFKASVRHWQSVGRHFSEGLDFGTSQREVVYRNPPLTRNQAILAWNGRAWKEPT